MPESKNVGKIIEIKGVVLDAVFPDSLPEILTALEIEVEGGTLVAEVQQHLGDDRVRAVAMDSTDGLARGLDVVVTEGLEEIGAGHLEMKTDDESVAAYSDAVAAWIGGDLSAEMPGGPDGHSFFERYAAAVNAIATLGCV